MDKIILEGLNQHFDSNARSDLFPNEQNFTNQNASPQASKDLNKTPLMIKENGSEDREHSQILLKNGAKESVIEKKKPKKRKNLDHMDLLDLKGKSEMRIDEEVEIESKKPTLPQPRNAAESQSERPSKTVTKCDLSEESKEGCLRSTKSTTHESGSGCLNSMEQYEIPQDGSELANNPHAATNVFGYNLPNVTTPRGKRMPNAKRGPVQNHQCFDQTRKVRACSQKKRNNSKKGTQSVRGHANQAPSQNSKPKKKIVKNNGEETRDQSRYKFAYSAIILHVFKILRSVVNQLEKEQDPKKKTELEQTKMIFDALSQYILGEPWSGHDEFLEQRFIDDPKDFKESVKELMGIYNISDQDLKTFKAVYIDDPSFVQMTDWSEMGVNCEEKIGMIMTVLNAMAVKIIPLEEGFLVLQNFDQQKLSYLQFAGTSKCMRKNLMLLREQDIRRFISMKFKASFADLLELMEERLNVANDKAQSFMQKKQSKMLEKVLQSIDETSSFGAGVEDNLKIVGGFDLNENDSMKFAREFDFNDENSEFIDFDSDYMAKLRIIRHVYDFTLDEERVRD